MKDLYKRLGIQRFADPKQIEAALQEFTGDQSTRAEARAILLQSKRREVYDRCHIVLTIIGQLRANLDLQHAQGWRQYDCSDFDCAAMREFRTDKPLHRKITKLERIRRDKPIARVGWLMAVLGISVLLLWKFIDADPPTFPPATKQPRPSLTSNESKSERTKRLVPIAPKVAFSASPKALPYNGFVTRFHSDSALAPLEVRTRPGNGNYFVKLVYWGTNIPVLTIFIRDGHSANVQVPLGTFEIRYCVGTTWYGTQHHFGPDTAYARAEDVFTFRETRNSYTGYTIDLYLQRDGNLKTTPIASQDF